MGNRASSGGRLFVIRPEDLEEMGTKYLMRGKGFYFLVDNHIDLLTPPTTFKKALRKSKARYESDCVNELSDCRIYIAENFEDIIKHCPRLICLWLNEWRTVYLMGEIEPEAIDYVLLYSILSAIGSNDLKWSTWTIMRTLEAEYQLREKTGKEFD